MKRNLSTGNQKGVALLYVLIALVFVGSIGTLVLALAHKEKGAGSLYASSEAARYSATAGLTYANNFFTETDDTEHRKRVDELLTRWYLNRNNTSIIKERWITGRGSGSGIAKYIDDSFYDAQDGMRFRAHIVNMDFSRFNPDGDSSIRVMFRSESIDNSGSRASNYGFYTITGFEPIIQEGEPAEINALHLGTINEVNTILTVNGSTYFQDAASGTSPSGVLNQSGHQFNGQFVRMAPNNDATSFNIGGVTFGGKTYFGVMPGVTTPPQINDNGGAVVFKQGFGSESPIKVPNNGATVESGNVYLNNKMIVNGGDGSSGAINFSGTAHNLYGSKLRKNGTTIDYSTNEHWQAVACAQTPAVRCVIRGAGTNVTSPALTETAMDIPAMMKINTKPTVLTINWNYSEFVKAGTHKVSQTGITGEVLSGFGDKNIYTATNGTKWRVVEINNGSKFAGGTFTGNTILILNTTYSGNGLDDGKNWDFPTSAADSRLVIISKDGNRVNGLTTEPGGTIRGLVISENKGRFRTSGNVTFEGALHLTGDAEFRIEGGAATTTTINENRPLINGILKELKGFINASGTPNPDDIAITGIRRRTDGSPVTTTMNGRGY